MDRTSRSRKTDIRVADALEVALLLRVNRDRVPLATKSAYLFKDKALHSFVQMIGIELGNNPTILREEELGQSIQERG